ncbi:MAG: family 43 glycosylhydrolase [Sphaerochaetaceae bacterium]|nr:family 43 glycosylhydrolase [Sphaerochaetaceae bacterium]
MIYNTSVRIGNLIENAQALEILERNIPGFARMTANPQALTLSVEQLIKYTRIPGGDKLLEKLNSELDTLNTKENAISPSEAKLIEVFKQIDLEDKKKCSGKTDHTQSSIEPGKPWLDTTGKRIQAHGGAVIYEDGLYYWYGENKEHTDGKNGIWTWGLKLYSSSDLCNWTDRGYLIPPVLDDPNSALFPTKRVDRPHILKCPSTGKYVCWIKLSGSEAAFTIWEAENLCGPYKMVENLYNPGNHKIGDFDLVCDSTSGRAFIYFDADHECMLCMELEKDFLHAEKEVCRNYPNLTPPFTREGPALFEKDGKKYMFTSGMTGYVPNRSDSAVSENWDSLFESLGNPHLEDASDASFNSQISKVFKVESTGEFIAMADRWLPDTPVDARLSDVITRAIASNYMPDKFSATDEEKKEMLSVQKLETADTSVSDYVWLPVSWEDGRPVIRWKDSWTPSV